MMSTLLWLVLAPLAPADEVNAVLQRAAQDRVPVVVEPGPQSGALARRLPRRATGPTGTLRLPSYDASYKSLSRSDALESFADRLRRLELDQARPYLLAAVGHLEREHPAERAAAVELLSLVPVHTVDSGLLPELGKLLDDAEAAFRGVEVSSAQDGAVPSRVRPAVITVREVTQAGLIHICCVRFADAEAFQVWWVQTRHDVEDSLWYWALRWRGSKPENLAELDDLDASAALKVSLLVGSDIARRAEIFRATPKQFADRIRADVGRHRMSDVDSSVIATMVKRRQMKYLLLMTTAGRQNWSFPESAHYEVTRQTIRLLPHVLTEADAPLLDRVLLQEHDPWSGHPETRTEAVRVLTSLVSDEQAEAIRVREVQRDLFLHGVAADLAGQTGWKHWTLIRQAYCAREPRPSANQNEEIIAALASHGEPAKAKLGELLAADSLIERSRSEDTHRQQGRFVAWVEAANRLSSDGPVISKALFERSCYEWGKGARDDSPHNLAVPENRARAVAELEAFFQ